MIEARGISFSYGDLEILRSISFTVRPGEFVSILGPSGCGKSTLLMILAGLLTPDQGQVFLQNRDCTSRPGELSFMHQKDLLLPWKNLMENLMVPLVLKKIPYDTARAEVVSFLPRFGLEGFEAFFPHQLSGGMRQRAALLRTFLYCRDILLLDEPFGALDAITRMKLQKWLLGFSEEVKSTVILVTHNLDEAVMLSDRILVLSKLPGHIAREIPVTLSHPRSQNVLISGELSLIKSEIAECLDL